MLRHQEQANHIADYWRSHYNAPLRNTPPEAVHTLFAGPPVPEPQPPTSPLASFTTSDVAMGLWVKLFGDGGHFEFHEPTDETSWPATELSEYERVTLQSCLMKLGTPIPRAAPAAPGDS